MALTGKKHEAFYVTTGSGADKIDSSKLTEIEAIWDTDKAGGCKEYMNDPFLGPIVFQLQQMQDELDYLRTEIETNKDNRIVIGSNTVISFGDMVTTLVKGKPVYTIVMTVVWTDPSNPSKVTTKAITLNLA